MSKRAIDTAVEIHEVNPAPAGGSDKAFGVVFGALFAILAFYPMVKGLPLRWWALAAGDIVCHRRTDPAAIAGTSQ